jgi:outer membrane protein TolC
MNTKTTCVAALVGSLVVACQSPSNQDSPYAVAAQSTVVAARSDELASPLESQASWLPSDGVAALLLRAETESPRVRAAFHQWQAMHARIAQTSALPNPWVSLGGYVQSVETRTGPMDGRLGLSQKFPWPGKLETAGDRTAALAEAQRMAVEDARLAVRRNFLRNWTERIYLEQAKSITREQVTLLQHLEDVSLSLYKASRVSQADVLRAQVERLKMVDQLDTLVQREAPLTATLEATLGAPLATVPNWQNLSFLDQDTLPNENDLRALLLEASPKLIALQARLDAAAEAQKLADLEDMPDFSLGVDWTWIGESNVVQPDSGDDALSISLAVEIPLQRGRITGAREQAFAERRQVAEQRQLQQWQLIAELQSAIAAHDDATRRVALFEHELLPKAEMTYATTLAAYQSGQAAFQSLLDAARVVLDFRLSTARASADAALAYADLNGLLPIALLASEEQN